MSVPTTHDLGGCRVIFETVARSARKLKKKSKRVTCVKAATKKYKKPPTATPPPQPPLPADPPTTDDRFISDRQPVTDAYFDDWAPAMDVPVGFTGKLSPCEPGTSSDKARAAHATVTVTRDGQPVAASVHQVANGHARAALVWEMPAASLSGSYTVTASNIAKQGTTQKLSHSYTVHFFHPTP